MIKLILIIVVGFLVYNWYLKPLLNPPPTTRLHKKNQAGQHPSTREKDDEYIDYEELKK
jgi:hypothetical protein